MYTYHTKVKMHDTDAAGILFFGNQFKMMHDAYEDMIEQAGFSFAEVLRHKDYFMPIVHAEADYKAKLFVGDPIEVQLTLEKIGRTSFTCSYELFKPGKILIGFGKTVHVTIDKKTGNKIPIPKEVLDKLKKL